MSDFKMGDLHSHMYGDQCEQDRTVAVESIAPNSLDLLTEADELILWAIRPGGSGVPVEDMLRRCYGWRMRYGAWLKHLGVE